MAQPEMTYSPAYYHHEHERVVALLPHDPPLSPLPALHLPLKQQQEPPLSYAAYRSPASGASSPEATSSLSDSSTASYSIPATTFVEPVPRSLEQPPAVPAAAFMLSPRAEEASISNFTSSSSGNAPKDDRSRASWSSYMSGENGPHCAPSAHNRVSVYAGIEEESDPSEKGPSALLMLVSGPSFPAAPRALLLYSSVKHWHPDNDPPLDMASSFVQVSSVTVAHT